LEENNGDMAAAVDFLRKKGIAKAEKRAGKSTSEGVVAAETQGGRGAIVELNCETDFVARTDDFQNLARALARQALATSSATDADALLGGSMDGTTIADTVKEASARLGEAVNVRRVARFGSDTGAVGAYVHFNGKIGVLVEVEAANGDQSETTVALARTLAEHVAAAAPLGVDKDIVTGKVDAYYKDVALLHQMWVREPKTPISQVVAQAAKEIGAAITVKRFARFQLGQE
jgi:elongation factor Ts